MSDGGRSAKDDASSSTAGAPSLFSDGSASLSDDAQSALEEALLDAVYEGDSAALSKVLSQRATVHFDIDAVDGTGATAFVVACMSDERAELIQPLLDAGCAVDCRYSLGATTGTGWEWATTYQCQDAIDALERAANLGHEGLREQWLAANPDQTLEDLRKECLADNDREAEAKAEEAYRAKIRAKMEEEARASRGPPLQEGEYCKLSLAGVSTAYGQGRGPLGPHMLAKVVMVVAEDGCDREHDDSKTNIQILKRTPGEKCEQFFWYQAAELERAPEEEWPLEPEPEPEPEPAPLTEDELLELAEQRIAEARSLVAAADKELDDASLQLPILAEGLAARGQPVIDALEQEATLRAQRAAHMEGMQRPMEEAIEGLKGIHWADFFELKRREFFIPELLKRVFDTVMILRHMDVSRAVGYEVDTDVHGVQHMVIEDSYDCVLPLLQTKWATSGAGHCTLVSELLAFNLDGVNDETIELLLPYMEMEDFKPTEAVEEMEAAGLDTSIAEGLCAWSLFVRDYRADAREFADAEKLNDLSRHRGYMQRLQRLATEALAAGRTREANARTALAEAKAELKAAEQSLLELLGEDEEALRRAAEARRKRNLQKARTVAHTAENLAQLRIEADETRRRAEEKERLQELWGTYDVDGSGDLDREEVRTVLKKMGRLVTEVALDRAFDDMDADGDGLVTFDEFVVWWDAQEGVTESYEVGWPFQADLDGMASFQIYEKAVQLKNRGEWQEALAMFEEYRHALTSELASTHRGTRCDSSVALEQQDDESAAGVRRAPAADGNTERPQEHRFEAKDPRSPVLPQKFGWNGVLQLPIGKDREFGNHKHLRSGAAPRVVRNRGEGKAPDDALLNTLSAQTDPAFWEQLALKQECREKYGLQGTVGFLSSGLALK